MWVMNIMATVNMLQPEVQTRGISMAVVADTPIMPE